MTTETDWEPHEIRALPPLRRRRYSWLAVCIALAPAAPLAYLLLGWGWGAVALMCLVAIVPLSLAWESLLNAYGHDVMRYDDEYVEFRHQKQSFLCARPVRWRWQDIRCSRRWMPLLMCDGVLCVRKRNTPFFALRMGGTYQVCVAYRLRRAPGFIEALRQHLPLSDKEAKRFRAEPRRTLARRQRVLRIAVAFSGLLLLASTLVVLLGLRRTPGVFTTLLRELLATLARPDWTWCAKHFLSYRAGALLYTIACASTALPALLLWPGALSRRDQPLDACVIGLMAGAPLWVFLGLSLGFLTQYPPVELAFMGCAGSLLLLGGLLLLRTRRRMTWRPVAVCCALSLCVALGAWLDYGGVPTTHVATGSMFVGHGPWTPKGDRFVLELEISDSGRRQYAWFNRDLTLDRSIPRVSCRWVIAVGDDAVFCSGEENAAIIRHDGTVYALGNADYFGGMSPDGRTLLAWSDDPTREPSDANRHWHLVDMHTGRTTDLRCPCLPEHVRSVVVRNDRSVLWLCGKKMENVPLVEKGRYLGEYKRFSLCVTSPQEQEPRWLLREDLPWDDWEANDDLTRIWASRVRAESDGAHSEDVLVQVNENVATVRAADPHGRDTVREAPPQRYTTGWSQHIYGSSTIIRDTRTGRRRHVRLLSSGGFRRGLAPDESVLLVQVLKPRVPLLLPGRADMPPDVHAVDLPAAFGDPPALARP